VTDANGHVLVSRDAGAYQLRRVWLSPEEERGYYDGFANEGLWPLCHMAFAAPIFRRSDWAAYERVNRRFADAIAEEIRTPRPIVLVQDYHFALVPQFLRQRRPDAITVTFWHIPWPTPKQFSVCPYACQILNGLLGSNVLGFQTRTHRDCFLGAVEALAPGAHRRANRIRLNGHLTEVRTYPISIEWPNRWVDAAPTVETCRRLVCDEFDLDPSVPIVVSVDRLDYSKGFDERLAAIERLLEAGAQKMVFLQIAAPTRVTIPRYRELAGRIRADVARINARYGNERFKPIVYVERHTEPADVFRYYRAADVCYVGSLDDGMNLVAKEFIAARDDERGTLVLSRFAGAADELTDALLVNPFDVDGVAETLATAIHLNGTEQQARMRRLRTWIAEHNVYAWADDMLADAARIRRVSPLLQASSASQETVCQQRQDNRGDARIQPVPLSDEADN
jgi:trehalose 6-phosphate synthase